jgi:hypothetical protein
MENPAVILLSGILFITIEQYSFYLLKNEPSGAN